MKNIITEIYWGCLHIKNKAYLDSTTGRVSGKKIVKGCLYITTTQLANMFTCLNYIMSVLHDKIVNYKSNYNNLRTMSSKEAPTGIITIQGSF